MTIDTDTRPPITAAATAFVESYARAMSFSSPTFPHSGNIPFIAAALSAHYSNTTAYALGHPYIISVQKTTEHLEKLERSGLGYEPGEGCGVEGWQWENVYGYVYGYRRAFQPSGVVMEFEAGAKNWIGEEGEVNGWEKPEGWWEVILCDNEVLEIFAKVPNYMEI
ncbi:hypothetical protein K438DRAFT_1995959 [Mycena galopus ATCC 62051]|nr:hypothetical protein K438DRAFT_1995959 [Mycena galopus ATCC 62051]